jgi:glycosyltransferase involved in cell wall biosynthesis
MLVARTQSATLNEDAIALPRPREAVQRHTNRFVCMIGYIDYPTDARVRREAETLAASGFHVLCLTTKNAAEPSRFVLNGVQIRELNVAKYRGKSTLVYLGVYLRFLILASLVCLRLLVRRELDVVHVHNMPDFLVFAGLLPRLFGAKVILDVHDSVPETFAAKFSGRSTFWKILCLEERMSALVAHKIICVNHPQRDILTHRGIPHAKTFISMNVPDPAIFTWAPDADPPAARGDTFNLVYHGTMVERLGVDLLIRAVEQLQDRIPCVRLHLWGNGDDLAAFQSLAQSLGVEDKVLFKPKGFPVQELPQHLRSMDVCVIGNRRSVACDLMLPVKLMECVALRIPTVVPRLKTIEHYFSEDMVAYYEPEDVRALADCLYRLYCDPARRRGQAERAGEFLAEYGWERQSTELVAFYHGIVEN